MDSCSNILAGKNLSNGALQPRFILTMDHNGFAPFVVPLFGFIWRNEWSFVILYSNPIFQSDSQFFH